jgi:hypothetical protein
MAISTPTTITAGGGTANSPTYDTALVTLTAGRLYIIVINGYSSGGGTNLDFVRHDLTGTPLDFIQITDGTDTAAILNWDAAIHRALHVWYVIPSTTTANAAIRIDWAATQSAAGWRLIEITSGFKTGTTAEIFPGVATNVDAGAGTAITCTMASFAATDNMTLLCMGWGQSTTNPTQTIVTTESRTELGEHNDGERCSQGVHYQNPHGSDTSIGATLSANNEWGAIGIEIAASGGISVARKAGRLSLLGCGHGAPR